MNPTATAGNALCLDENGAMRVVLDPEDPRVASARAHVDGCDACRELVAAVARIVVGDEDSTGAPWTEARLAPGTQIGAYRIIEATGAGAMGRVYRAVDTRLDREVALKLLDPGLQDEEAQRRVTAEARSMAQLQHPNVVEVFDVGSGAYGPYVTMAYVDGWELSGWLAAKPRSPTQILACLDAAGRGVAAAHTAGVVHRDLKPANILVGRDGTVRVADFGLAVASAAAQHERAIAGTPAYMAPEQVAGEPATPATDQFAFCVTLFEALAGHRPFPESSVLARRDAIEAGQLRPSERPLPESVLRPLRRGLQAKPDQRFPDMRALLEALHPQAVTRWRLPAAIGLAALGGAYVAWGSGASAPAECGTHTPAPWSTVERERMQAAWQEMGAPAYTTTRLLQRLDAHAQSWTELHRRTCIAMAPDPSPTLHARLRCLEQARTDLEAFVSAAASAPPSRADRFAASAEELRPATDCVDNTAWLEHPEFAAHVEALRNRYLRDQAGDSREARAALRADILAAHERADEADPGLEHATLSHLLGALDSLSNQHESASQWFERAYFVAREHAAAAQAFDAAVANAVELGTYLHRIPEAHEWFRHAHAALGDLDDNERQARLLLREGDLHLLASDLDAALVAYRAAEARIPFGVPHHVPASLYGSLGQVFAMRGEDAECRGAYQESLQHIERTLGRDHRSLIRPLLGIASCEFDPEFYASGRAHIERAVQLSQLHNYVLGEAMARGNLGLHYRILEQPTASLRELLRSDELMRESYPADHFVVGQSGRNIAIAYLATGRWEEAATAAASAARVLESQPIDAAPFLFDCEWVAAYADLKRGEPGTAARLRELFARAPTQHAKASVRLALAEALVSDKQHDEVITLLAAMYDDTAPPGEISTVRLAEGRLSYALALNATGETDSGREQLRAALALAVPYAADDPRDVVGRIREQLGE